MIDFRCFLRVENPTWNSIGVYLGNLVVEKMRDRNLQPDELAEGLIDVGSLNTTPAMHGWNQEVSLFNKKYLDDYLSGKASFGSWFPDVFFLLELKYQDLFRNPHSDERESWNAEASRTAIEIPMRYGQPIFYEVDRPFETMENRILQDFFKYVVELSVESGLHNLTKSPGAEIREYFCAEILKRISVDELHNYISFLKEYYGSHISDPGEVVVGGIINRDFQKAVQLGSVKFNNELDSLFCRYRLTLRDVIPYEKPCEAEQEEVLHRWVTQQGGFFHPGVHVSQLDALLEDQPVREIRPADDETHRFHRNLLPHSLITDGLLEFLTTN